MREDWMAFNDTEIFNVARTVDLAWVHRVGAVRVSESRTDWMREQFLGFGFGQGGFGQGPFGGDPGSYTEDFGDLAQAPWWNGSDVSEAFLGAIPLRVQGIDDSSRESSVRQYVGDGGFTGTPRNGTKTLVFSAVLVALNEAGAEYGKRWMNHVLAQRGERGFCRGGELSYFRTSYARKDHDSGGEPRFYPIDRMHLRDVRLTRGISVTRRTNRSCYSLWTVTFTMEAGDPYEYGPPNTVLRKFGVAVGDGTYADNLATTTFSSTNDVTVTDCATADYTPFYDPTYPALDPPPVAPDFLPQGWFYNAGAQVRRFYADVYSDLSLEELETVPVVALRSSEAARMIRVSINAPYTDIAGNCDAVFGFVLSYLPANSTVYVDAEQKVAYLEEDGSGIVRRCDSLLFGIDGRPIDWDTRSITNGMQGYMRVFLDVPYINKAAGTIQGGGTVQASLSLVAKSD